jgi:hypothetical protein
MKYGSPEDIAKLPPPTNRNKQHALKQGGWTIEKSAVRRVRKRTCQLNVNTDDVVGAFANNFAHVADDEGSS